VSVCVWVSGCLGVCVCLCVWESGCLADNSTSAVSSLVPLDDTHPTPYFLCFLLPAVRLPSPFAPSEPTPDTRTPKHAIDTCGKVACTSSTGLVQSSSQNTSTPTTNRMEKCRLASNMCGRSGAELVIRWTLRTVKYNLNSPSPAPADADATAAAEGSSATAGRPGQDVELHVEGSVM
jgi:hypothetical protein